MRGCESAGLGPLENSLTRFVRAILCNIGNVVKQADLMNHPLLPRTAGGLGPGVMRSRLENSAQMPFD